MIQAPVPAQIIDKGIATACLLAQVLVAKYADHLPLYRQEGIFARAGIATPRSTLGAWVGLCDVQLQPLVDALRQELLGHRELHADETPMAMLKPGNKKTHRAYLWAYVLGVFEDMKAVIYIFCESRAGEHARAFLDDGQLPIDNNWAENQIRPIAIGRKNWPFAGSLRAGQRVAAIMSLIQSARLNGHDPYAHLKDVLQRLPTHKNYLIAKLLPHRWQTLNS